MSWQVRCALMVCVWLATHTSSLAQPSARFIVDQWRVDDGLPQNTVTAIAQDARGYLWIATRKGLARFDGVHFQQIARVGDHDIGAMRLTSVLPDADGALWIGTYGHGVLRLAGGVATRYGTADGVPHDVVWNLTRDRDGRVWLASAGGARFFDGRRWQSPALPADLSGDGVNAVYQSRDGRLWFGTSRNGVVSVDGKAVRRYSTGEGLPATTATSIAEAPDGTMWVATATGLASITDDTVTAFGRSAGLSGDRVLQVLVDHRGTVWAATHGGGLARGTGGSFRSFGRDDGLSSEYVISLHEDRDGALWVGTLSGGLNRLAPAARELLDARSGLPPYPVTTIYQKAATGTFWVGTYGGGLARIRDGRVRVYGEADGLPSTAITSVVGGPGDSVWVGTNGAGAFRFLDGRILERLGPEVVGAPVRTIEVDHQGGGAVWFGGDGLVRYANGQWQHLDDSDGLRSSEVRVIYTMKDRVWVGTYGGGLQSIERDGRIVSWGERQGLTNRFVTSLHADDTDTLWIGTYGGGLFRLRDGRMDAITSEDGLPDDVVFDILEDKAGRLWLTSTQGLAVVRMSDIDARINGRTNLLSVSLYGRTEGVPGTDGTDGNQPLSWRAADDRLWFATVDGVVIFDPTEVADTPPAPRVYVDDVLVDKQLVPTPLGDAPLAGRNLDVRFSAPVLQGGRAVQYEYRLVGLDDRWVDAGTSRTAAFTNLEPGEYGLEMRARSGRGAAPGPVLRLPIVVPARLHETAWFRAAAGTLLLLGVVGLVGSRVTRLQRRQQQLQATVEERTAALRHEMQERERAERQRRILDERVQQAQRLESLGVLAGGVAHDFNNLLVGVLGEAGLALADLPADAPVRRHVERIERAALRASDLTAQMLAYSGGGRFIVVNVGLESLVREVLDLLAADVPPTIRVTVDMPDELPAVAGDPSQLRQVVRNLVINAVDAIGEQPGRISIAAGTRLVRSDDSVAARPDLPTMAPGAYVWLSVQDDGVGMDADTTARVFDPFFTSKSTGRGLGLAAALGIVRSQGGRIAVASQPGLGSTFTVLMPAARQARVGQAGPGDISIPSRVQAAARQRDGVDVARSEEPRDASATDIDGPVLSEVLVVDDERLVRDVARVALRRAGHAVSEVPTGEEAVEMFAARADDFGLVLLDLTLPGMQGRAVMHAVRAIRPDVPIVLTSGYTAEEAGDLTRAPRTTFLQKPWRPDQLVRCVADLMQHPS